MSTGPIPATITLLERLGDFPVRSKLRFLACVDAYYPRSATLVLSHRPLYPTGTSKTQSVRLDISLLVNTLPSGSLAGGEWLNVIGYITEPPSKAAQSQEGIVYVQAIHVWPAGGINLGAYERSLREKLDIDKQSEAIASSTTLGTY